MKKLITYGEIIGDKQHVEFQHDHFFYIVYKNLGAIVMECYNRKGEFEGITCVGRDMPFCDVTSMNEIYFHDARYNH